MHESSIRQEFARTGRVIAKHNLVASTHVVGQMMTCLNVSHTGVLIALKRDHGTWWCLATGARPVIIIKVMYAAHATAMVQAIRVDHFL